MAPSHLNAKETFLLLLLTLFTASLFSIVFFFLNNLKVTEKFPSAVPITIFLKYFKVNLEHDVPVAPQNTLKYLLQQVYSFFFFKDILLHNHNTTTKIQRLTGALYYCLILDSIPAPCEPLAPALPSADQT